MANKKRRKRKPTARPKWDGMLSGQHPGGHNLRPDYSDNPQIAGLVKAKGCGASTPRTPNYKGFQTKRQEGKHEIFVVCGDLRAGVRAGAVVYSEDLEVNRPQAGREIK